jgi:hypothetical protein
MGPTTGCGPLVFFIQNLTADIVTAGRGSAASKPRAKSGDKHAVVVITVIEIVKSGERLHAAPGGAELDSSSEEALSLDFA